MSLRIIFMGTPDFSVPTLQALAAAGHTIAAVYTQPPRPAGRRGLELVPSPVARAAAAMGVEVRTPLTLRDAAEHDAFADLRADLAVVVAYGLLLPKPVLDAPRLGCVNGHASLLPRWRGAAPIQRAIMAGDATTGMMIMRMEQGLDTGPVGLAEELAIGRDETAGELHDRLSALSARLMVDAVARLEAGTLDFVAQSQDGVTYAAKLDKAEARIDWSGPAATVHDRIRGLSPFPGAWCEVDLGGRGERLKLLRSTLVTARDTQGQGQARPGEILDEALTVACGSGALRLTELQRAGGKAVTAEEFLRGAKLEKGMILR